MKPTEKLPLVHLLTMVPAPEKGERFFSVVAVEMQGDRVLRRRVVDCVESRQEALDELCRVATRIFYFLEGKQIVGGEQC